MRDEDAIVDVWTLQDAEVNFRLLAQLLFNPNNMEDRLIEILNFSSDVQVRNYAVSFVV